MCRSALYGAANLCSMQDVPRRGSCRSRVGHKAECDGVAALGAHIAKQFGVAYQFIDVDSPL